jgi:hypothetical protein
LGARYVTEDQYFNTVLFGPSLAAGSEWFPLIQAWNALGHLFSRNITCAVISLLFRAVGLHSRLAHRSEYLHQQPKTNVQNDRIPFCLRTRRSRMDYGLQCIALQCIAMVQISQKLMFRQNCTLCEDSLARNMSIQPPQFPAILTGAKHHFTVYFRPRCLAHLILLWLLHLAHSPPPCFAKLWP